jgi:small subunit ribosomal protein S18
MVKNNSKSHKVKKKKIGPNTDYFLSESIDYIDYKNTNVLRRFINNQGRIVGRLYSRLTAKNQRKVTRAIKRARQMALLPYTIVEQK